MITPLPNNSTFIVTVQCFNDGMQVCDKISPNTPSHSTKFVPDDDMWLRLGLKLVGEW